MSPVRRIPIVVSMLLSLATIPFVAACGQKGNPTLRSFEPPPQVAALRAVHREGEILLSWEYPAQKREMLRGFELERAEAAGPEHHGSPEGFRLVARLPADAAWFADGEFRNGTVYLYRLRPVSSRNVQGAYSPVLEVTPREPPAAPRGLRCALGDASVEISWEKAAGDVRYDVFRRLEGGAYPGAIRNAAPLDENRFTDTIDAARKVHYSVRAFRPTTLRDEGPFSQELQVDPAAFVPRPPAGLRFIASDRAVFLLWKESPELWVKGYRVYRKGSADPDQTLIGFAPTPAFRDERPLEAPARYCVSAQGPSAESPGQDCVDVPAAR